MHDYKSIQKSCPLAKRLALIGGGFIPPPLTLIMIHYDTLPICLLDSFGGSYMIHCTSIDSKCSNHGVLTCSKLGRYISHDTVKESFLVELVTCHDSGRCRDGFETNLEEGATQLVYSVVM